MALYFTGRKDRGLIEFQYNNGKAKIRCQLTEWWKSLDITEATCGDPVEYTVEKFCGISETDKHALEATIEASLGLEQVAQLKSTISEKIETELRWEVSKKEIKKFLLNPPKCGRKINGIFQLVREYSITNERRRLFGRIESWATLITEYLNHYSVRPNVEPWISDCGCKEQLPDFDGTFDCDFGAVGLQVPGWITKNGLKLDFDGMDGELDLTDESEIDKLEISVPTRVLPEVMLWLGNIDREKIEGLLVPFDHFTIPNYALKDQSRRTAITTGIEILDLSVSRPDYTGSSLTK